MPNSLSPLLDREAVEQLNNPLLRGCKLVFGSLKLLTQLAQLAPDITRRHGLGVSHVGPAGRPNVDNAFGFQEAEGRTDGVAGDAVRRRELAVRGELRSRPIHTLLDVRAQDVRQATALVALTKIFATHASSV